jgi:hypothetical protein
MEEFNKTCEILKQVLLRNLDSKLTRELAVGILTTFVENAKPKEQDGELNRDS